MCLLFLRGQRGCNHTKVGPELGHCSRLPRLKSVSRVHIYVFAFEVDLFLPLNLNSKKAANPPEAVALFSVLLAPPRSILYLDGGATPPHHSIHLSLNLCVRR